MIVLRSIYQNHLVFNCLCGHVGKVAVKDLMLKYGGDTTLDAVEKAARCSRCRGKNITSTHQLCPCNGLWYILHVTISITVRNAHSFSVFGYYSFV